MQGLHLTGDLFGCGCSAATFTDLDALSTLCREATLDARLTIVDEKWHAFPDWNGQPGGITGTILLAESHLAIHTWPESRGVTLDVYVCNFTEDNTAKAELLFDTLTVAFRPQRQVVNRITRGDVSAGGDNASEGRAAEEAAQSQLSFDWLNAHSGYGFTVKEKLAEIESAYQRVEVFDTHQFGRLFRLDGRLMTSEGDEFFYHECMTHPAALAHPNPESVLVIGGGDGGSSEELFKHPSVRRIVMAELDPIVIEISRKYLGSIHRGALDDPRLEIRIGDGFEYVRSTSERFDMIVLDLTDPDTPAFHLYSEEFFRMCQRVLKPGGMLTLHWARPSIRRKPCARTPQICARCSSMSRRFRCSFRCTVHSGASQSPATRSIRAPRPSRQSRSECSSATSATYASTIRRCMQRCSRCRSSCRNWWARAAVPVALLICARPDAMPGLQIRGTRPA